MKLLRAGAFPLAGKGGLQKSLASDSSLPPDQGDSPILEVAESTYKAAHALCPQLPTEDGENF